MKKVNLKTGELKLKDNKELNELIGFGSRNNKKRGFLFISKVLGKHIPAKPSAIEKVHSKLAEKIKEKLDFSKPTIVLGFAETATGIGNGVFEKLDLSNSFYLHTTRYKLKKEKILSFEEEHCHAPSHILYELENKENDKLLKSAENIILVDDEVTTGNTCKNIIEQLKKNFPQVKNYFVVSILNWMGKLDSEINYIHLYGDKFEFTPKEFVLDKTISVTSNEEYLDEYIPYNFGRFGINKLNINFNDYISLNDLKDKKVLVLGTGEFMHVSFLLGKYLEDNDIESYIQSTTRSPVNLDYDIKSKISFKDNYFENIDNFLYNVIDKKYDKVLICYETTKLPTNHNLKKILAEYFTDIEEIFIKN